MRQAYDCPAKLEPREKQEIEETSLRIFSGLGVADCARIDYRMNIQGELYFLEVNTLPGLNPDEKVVSYLPLAARAAGLSFPKLVKRIIDEAKGRY